MAYNDPYVKYGRSDTFKISSSEVLFFGADEYVTEVTSLIIANESNLREEINIEILKGVYKDNDIDLEQTKYILFSYKLKNGESVDLLNDKMLYLEPIEILYARSKESDESFNIFLSYRQYLELDGVQ